MREKVTIRMNPDGSYRLQDGRAVTDLNPKELLLLAAADCAGKTAMMVLKKSHLEPVALEIGVSGELSTPTLQAESVFTSFHMVYNASCDRLEEQERLERALTLSHEKYCGLAAMLRKIAPLSLEVAIVSTHEHPL